MTKKDENIQSFENFYLTRKVNVMWALVYIEIGTPSGPDRIKPIVQL